MEDNYSEIERENVSATRAQEGFDEDAYPTSMDITRYVEDAVRGGMTPFEVAKAIFAGFESVDPFKAEQCAEELLDIAIKAQLQ